MCHIPIVRRNKLKHYHTLIKLLTLNLINLIYTYSNFTPWAAVGLVWTSVSIVNNR